MWTQLMLCVLTIGLSPAYGDCDVTFRVFDTKGRSAPYEVKSFKDRDSKDHAKTFNSLRGKVPCGSLYRYELSRTDARNAVGNLHGTVSIEHSVWRTLVVPHNLVVHNGLAGILDGGGIDYVWRGKLEGANTAGLWVHLRSTLNNYDYQTATDENGSFSIYERPYVGEYLLYLTDSSGTLRHLSALRVDRPGPSAPLIVKLVPDGLPVRSVE